MEINKINTASINVEPLNNNQLNEGPTTTGVVGLPLLNPSQDNGVNTIYTKPLPLTSLNNEVSSFGLFSNTINKLTNAINKLVNTVLNLVDKLVDKLVYRNREVSAQDAPMGLETVQPQQISQISTDTNTATQGTSASQKTNSGSFIDNLINKGLDYLKEKIFGKDFSFGAILDKGKELLGGLVNKGKNILTGIGSSILDKGKDFLGGLVSKGSSILSGIGSSISNVGSSILSGIQNIGSSIASGLSGIFGSFF